MAESSKSTTPFPPGKAMDHTSNQASIAISDDNNCHALKTTPAGPNTITLHHDSSGDVAVIPSQGEPIAPVPANSESQQQEQQQRQHEVSASVEHETRASVSETPGDQQQLVAAPPSSSPARESAEPQQNEIAPLGKLKVAEEESLKPPAQEMVKVAPEPDATMEFTDVSTEISQATDNGEDNIQQLSEVSNQIPHTATNDSNDQEIVEVSHQISHADVNDNNDQDGLELSTEAAANENNNLAEASLLPEQAQLRPKKKRRSVEDSEVAASQQPLLVMDFPANGLVDISLDEIKTHFICSLCGGLYREPYTVNECLHTFCKSCLFFSFFRAKNKHCPECNITIGTDHARSAVFRSDGSLRELVKVLFPAVYKEDEEREREFYAKRGIPLKPTYAKEELEGHQQKPAAVNASVETTANDEVSFTLVPIRRGPKRLRLPGLSRPCLRTSGRIKIGQLKKYLVTKLSLSQDPTVREIDVLCNGVSLGNELSLTFVIRTMWLHANSDLELKYMFAREG